jgi:hypothetical protein
MKILIMVLFINGFALSNLKVVDNKTQEELTGVCAVVNDVDTLYSDFNGNIVYDKQIKKIDLSLVSYKDTSIVFTENIVRK